MKSLADAYVAARVERDPQIVYQFKLPPPAGVHSRLPDRTVAGQRRYEEQIDRLADELKRIDRAGLTGDARILHALLEEELAGDQATRVCRNAMWDVSHFEGLVTDMQGMAARQPVGMPALRRAALARWNGFPVLIDQHIANLKRGVAAGYSVPRPVAERVAAQLDQLIALDIEKSPYFSPAVRDGDARFAVAFQRVLAGRVMPALARYSAYLKRDYMPAARESLGLWALPNGRECFRAMARKYSTVDRSAQQYWDLAEPRNAAGLAVAIRIGKARFGTSDVAVITERARSSPDEKYPSAEAMLDEAKAIVARSRTAFLPMFRSLPTQGVDVRANRPEDRGLGLPHRLAGSTVPGGPVTYWVPAEQFANLPRSTNITASIHEAIPGHMMVAPRPDSTHALFRLSRLAAFNEGWAQYAETLGDEAGIPLSDTGKIILSPVNGRMTLFEVGMHHTGWDRDQLQRFFLANGGHPKRFEDFLLRSAAFPAYALAYDVGKGEMLDLRAEAERKLGDRFDIRGFHDAVLKDGPVPLWLLRENVETWIRQAKSGR